MKFYFDTAIWIDMHENRTDRFRPLGEWAFELLRKIREERHTVVYSEITIRELLTHYSTKEIEEMLGGDFLEKISISESQAKEAREISRSLGIPWGDCLHAILAKDNNAIMIARDRHFEQLRFLADVKKPEELI